MYDKYNLGIPLITEFCCQEINRLSMHVEGIKNDKTGEIFGEIFSLTVMQESTLSKVCEIDIPDANFYKIQSAFICPRLARVCPSKIFVCPPCKRWL